MENLIQNYRKYVKPLYERIAFIVLSLIVLFLLFSVQSNIGSLIDAALNITGLSANAALSLLGKLESIISNLKAIRVFAFLNLIVAAVVLIGRKEERFSLSTVFFGFGSVCLLVSVLLLNSTINGLSDLSGSSMNAIGNQLSGSSASASFGMEIIYTGLTLAALSYGVAVVFLSFGLIKKKLYVVRKSLLIQEEVSTVAYKKFNFNFKKYVKVYVAAAVVIGVFAGYRVWDTYFNKTKVDVFEFITVKYSGLSGEGKAKIVRGTPVIDDSKVVEFLDDVKYEVTTLSGLSNGDTVQVVAKLNNALLEKYKLKVDTTTKTFTVAGLAAVPTDVNGIADYEALVTKMRNEAKSALSKTSSLYTYTYTEKDIFYAGDSSSYSFPNGTVMIAYDVKRKSIYSNTETQMVYYYYITGILVNEKGERIADDGKPVTSERVRYLTGYVTYEQFVKEAKSKGFKEVAAEGGL